MAVGYYIAEPETEPPAYEFEAFYHRDDYGQANYGHRAAPEPPEPPERTEPREPRGSFSSWIERARNWIVPRRAQRPAPCPTPAPGPPRLTLVPPAPRARPAQPAPRRHLVLVTDATAAEIAHLRRTDGEAKVCVGIAKLRAGLRLLSDDPAPPDLSESYRELCRAQKEMRRIVRRAR